MNILNIKSNNIFFFLALEEYLIKNTNDDWFFLWSSDNCVVCGKHQNIYEEINLHYIIDNNIKLARRLSGGGTVFQDKGNLNFTFILNKENGKQIDFKKHIEPIYKYIKSLNIDVEYSKRNDLFIDNKKISGNAEHVYKNRVLHHGTLLFNSDLSKLNEVLKVKGKYKSKSVKSVRKNVTNINNYTNNINFNDFKIGLNNYVKDFFNIDEYYLLDNDIINRVKVLAKNKYKTHEWIFNYTSNFKYSGIINSEKLQTTFNLHIKKGKIVDCNFNNYTKLNKYFIGKEYKIDSILTIIIDNNLSEILKINPKELLYCFF